MNRVGFGFDSHRFVAGRPLVLGGVAVPHEMGLAGHSDADAALHALIDAILGAMALGDIGSHFPDTDPRWHNADSAALLTHAVGLAREQLWRPGNCDITIVAERPKLRPHKLLMQERIAQLLGLDPRDVSVKAKTNEGMGWIGSGEGLAAFAVVCMRRMSQGDDHGRE